MRCLTEGIQRLKSAVTKRKGRGFKASKLTLVNLCLYTSVSVKFFHSRA